jgi:hypothetical protein
MIGVSMNPAYSGTAVSPKTIVSQLKKNQTDENVRKSLNELGLSDSITNAFSNYQLSEDCSLNLFQKKYLIRAEYFKRNVDTSAADEYVTQIIFQCGSEAENTQVKVYFMFVNGDSTMNFRPLWQHAFEHNMCSLLTSGKMTFRFGADNGTSYSKILFLRNVVESCGVELAAYDQTDTLLFKDGRFELVVGKRSNEFYRNRNAEIE